MSRNEEVFILQNRQHVIDTAISLFREKGYDAVTVSEICKASGIAYGTFFNHFKGKGALLCEYVLSLHGEDVTIFLALSKKTALEKLMTMITQVSQVPTQLGAPLLMQFMTLRIQDTEFWNQYESISKQHRTAYCGLIEEAQRDGDIRNMSAPLDLLCTMHDVTFATHTAWAVDPSFDFESRLAARIETVLDIAPHLRRYS